MRPTRSRVERYLERYAEVSAGCARHVRGRWRKVLVLPLHGENISFWAGIAPALQEESVLVVAVVNATPEASREVRQANVRVLRALGGGTSHALGAGALQGRYADQDLVLIDASQGQQVMAAGQGVGLARKLGLDLACALWAHGGLESPWLHTTDADATLSRDYFAGSDDVRSGAAALTYRFWHTLCGEASVDRATALYEVWMRYYAVGLARAGSPFAMHTLGSTIAVHADAYSAARGVPKRQAGEDFHLLAKLAKLGAIVTPEAGRVELASRLSTRVPFGTGPGVASFRAGLERGIQPSLYDPRAFAALSELLRYLARVEQGGLPSLSTLSAPVEAAWAEVGGLAGLERALRGARGCKARRMRVLQWFDALRTLRFVHALHRHGYRERSWSDALQGLGFALDTSPLCTTLRAELVAALPRVAGLQDQHTAADP